MTNGTSDSSDIDSPSPDAKTAEKQRARHKPEKSCFPTARKKLGEREHMCYSKQSDEQLSGKVFGIS